MQFYTLFSTAILATIVSAIPISLTVVSTNEEINNFAVTAVHEGAGINYIQLGENSNSQLLEFDESNGNIYTVVQTEGSESYRLSLSIIPNTESYTGFPYLQLSVTYPNTKWSRGENGELIASTGDKIYAAKNTNDPYNYSKEYFLAGVGNPEIFGDSVTDLTEISITINELVL